MFNTTLFAFKASGNHVKLLILWKCSFNKDGCEAVIKISDEDCLEQFGRN